MGKPVTLLLAAVAILALSAGCGDKDDKDRSKGQGKSYAVRGEVTKVGPEGKAVNVRHEAIPSFVNAFGDTSTMQSMTMEFGASGVSLDEIAAGDKVKMTFHTDWDAKPALQIDSIEKLPPDTELEF